MTNINLYGEDFIFFFFFLGRFFYIFPSWTHHIPDIFFLYISLAFALILLMLLEGALYYPLDFPDDL